MEPKKTITWQQVKDFANGLNEEQLAETVYWSGEERGGSVTGADVLTEDHYRGEYCIEGASSYEAEALEEMEVAYKAGTPFIYVD